MKNILLIHTHLAGGGAEKVLLDILQMFDYSTYKVTLLLLWNKGVYLKDIPANVEIHYIYNAYPNRIINSILWRMKPLKRMILRKKTLKAIGNSNFDCIISFMEGLPLLIHSFVSDYATRNISWVHCDLKKLHYTKSFFGTTCYEEKLYKRLDEIIFVSEMAKKTFCELFPKCNTKKSVVYNPISPEIINRRSMDKSVPKRKFTIINVGRLCPQKRQDRIIQVAKLLKERGHDFEIWILGQGELEQKLKKMSVDNNVNDRIVFWGFKTNPYIYMKSADLFLLTSDAEGYPLVVAEALSLGLPIISTNITGPSEMINQGTGILTSNNTTEITNAVESLIVSDKLRNEYHKKSLCRATEFVPEEIMKKIYSVIG